MQTCARTPVCRVAPKIFMKCEFLQLGGSHKSRAARAVIAVAEKQGQLLDHSRAIIIEKTGGNFGLGLACHAASAGYRIQLLIRPAFSFYKRKQLSHMGVELIGLDEMAKGLSNKEIIEIYANRARESGLIPFLPDQFSNKACIDAHMVAATEYVSQLIEIGIDRHQPICLLLCVGSGASMVAYAAAFRYYFSDVTVVVAQPAGCDFLKSSFADHPFDGASVGVVPPFFRPELVDKFVEVGCDEGISAVRDLFLSAGIYAGNTSGLVFFAAKEISRTFDGVIATIGYDSGESYTADRLINHKN